ncbi:MAG: hypothetical protein ACJAT4_001420 [Granulosicoccus sp.]|jgi:hypothetical protein
MRIFPLLTSFFLLVNTSYSQFASPVIITEEGEPSDITSADFNQDGWIDLAYVQNKHSLDTAKECELNRLRIFTTSFVLIFPFEINHLSR